MVQNHSNTVGKAAAKQHSPFTTAAGPLMRRTAPLSQARAEAFARCLAANKRFDARASVHETKAGSGRYYVAFLPAAPASQQAILAAYQQEQIDRAIDEMDGYSYEPIPAGVLVTTLPNRNGVRDTYHVQPDLLHCTCPHFEYRLKEAGVLCKHLVAAFARTTDPITDPITEE